MDLALKDKVVLITGGASGIGAAIARACTEEAALPVILDRDNAAIQAFRSELDKKGITNESVVVDLTDTANTSRVIEEVGRKLGRIDGVVNNAGINDGVSLENGTPDQFLLSLERNLIHYHTVARAALPFLKRAKGTIVNIASKVAVTGQGGTSGYAASKGGILGLTCEWAAELSQYGIRVNAIIPAEVLTPQYAKWLKKFDDPDEQLRRITSRIPLDHRMTDPSEVASMAVFLLSPTSASITGQHLFVDGGYVHLDRSLT